MKANKVVDIELWDKQHLFATDMDFPAILVDSGIGYGKTFGGAVMVRLLIENYQNNTGMIVSRDLPQFKKAVLPELLSVFRMFGDVEGKDYKHNRADNFFYFHKQNVTIYYVGAVNYDSSFRGPNVGWIWADEADYYKAVAWETMLGP